MDVDSTITQVQLLLNQTQEDLVKVSLHNYFLIVESVITPLTTLFGTTKNTD